MSLSIASAIASISTTFYLASSPSVSSSTFVVGADYVAPAVRIVTFVLSLYLSYAAKKSGRITSPIQFLFWLLQVETLFRRCDKWH